MVDGQLLMLSTNLLKSQIPMSRVGGWVGGGGWQPTFDAKSKVLKSQLPMFRVGGGGGWQPTFDAESKFAKI